MCKNACDVLPDVLKRDLVLVFCGTAAGERSATVGEYYAGRGNKFWKVLHTVGITDVQLLPSEYTKLLDCGVGLTDLVKDQSGMDKDVRFAGARYHQFADRIKKYNPSYLCFNGKRSAQEYLGRKVTYGPQQDKIGHTSLFVLPSTSGAAAGFWNEIYWREIADLYRRAR